MTKTAPTYDLQNDEDLSKFLLGAIRDVRKADLEVDKAEAISQLADKYIKLKIARVIEHKAIEGKAVLNANKEINKALLTKVASDEIN